MEDRRNNFRRDSRPPRFNQGDRKMFPAVCAECKQNCEVPFKPREDGGPIYCKDCFKKHRPARNY